MKFYLHNNFYNLGVIVQQCCSIVAAKKAIKIHESRACRINAPAAASIFLTERNYVARWTIFNKSPKTVERERERVYRANSRVVLIFLKKNELFAASFLPLTLICIYDEWSDAI